jgi:rare lipoprotein A
MRSAASLAALLVAGCGGGQGPSASAPPSLVYGGYAATGLASWYGEELAGERTASGERFDPAGLTVAHRTLPLGSLVEVTAPETRRSVVARVNDRGPGRAERLVDLSRGTAQALGLDRRSLATVRLRAVERNGYNGVRGPALARIAPPLLGRGPYVVQVAAFTYRPRAKALAEALDADVERDDGLYRVRLGPYREAADAQRARDVVVARGYGDAQILSTR